MPDVVDGSERCEQDLAGQKQVAQVCPAEVPAAVAVAGGIDRLRVLFETSVLDHHFAVGAKQITVSGVPGWENTVHHVHASGDVLGKFVRHSNAHAVTGPVLRKQGSSRFRHFLGQWPGFADRKPADRIAIRIQLEQIFGAGHPQVREHTALNDGEQGMPDAIRMAAVVLKGSFGPSLSSFCRIRSLVVSRWIGETFVQDHTDVTAERELYVDRGLGREPVGRTVDVRLKGDTALVDITERVQAEHLKAAGVGQDGAWPARKAVEAAKTLHRLVAGPKEQVIGVGEYYLRVEFVL